MRYWTFDDGIGEAVETKLYFDHICNGDNKQDKEAVVALVEAFLLSLHREVPQITRLTFQSDNASSYQSAYVGLMLPVLGAAHGFYVARYVHSDTQDGKSMLDAHFATAARKVKAWVHQGNDCATPTEVVKALTADGGLPNCVVELVEHDRLCGRLLYEQVQPLEKSLAKIIDRANDILYEPPSPLILSSNAPFDLKKCPAFRIKVFEYSGIGEGVKIVVSPTSGKCCLAGDVPIPSDSVDTTNPSCARLDGLQGENNGVRNDLPPSSIRIGEPDAQIQRRLDFDGDDEADGSTETNEGYQYCEDEEEGADVEFSDDECSSDDSEAGGDDAGKGVEYQGMVQSREITGLMTGIRVKTSAQVRRRVHLANVGSVGHFARVRSTAVISEKDVEAYAKRSLRDMNVGGEFSDIVARGGLTAKMLTIATNFESTPASQDCCRAMNADELCSDVSVTNQKSGTQTTSEAVNFARLTGVVSSMTDTDGSTNLTSHADGNCVAHAPKLLKRGWARRPKRGEMYGAKYIHLYEKGVEEMFQQGEENPSRKMGPARMLESLTALYPHIYNLPGENEIRGLITKLMKRRRQSSEVSLRKAQFEARSPVSAPRTQPPLRGGTDVGLSAGTPQQSQPRRNRRMESSHATFLAGLVVENPSIMPKTALALFYERFPQARGTTNEKQIRDKVSDLKRKPKTSRRQGVPPEATTTG